MIAKALENQNKFMMQEKGIKAAGDQLCSRWYKKRMPSTTVRKSTWINSIA
jgi:hypothetical protein